MRIDFTPRLFMNPQADLKAAKELVEVVEVLKDSFKSLGIIIKQEIGDNIQDADRFTKAYGKTLASDLTKSFNNLGKRSEEILKNQEALKNGQAKSRDILKQIEQIEQKRKSISIDLKNALKAGVISQQQYTSLLSESLQKHQETVDALRSQSEYAERTENAMGNLGNIVKGLNKIPVLGNLIDSEKVLEKMQKTAAKTGSTFAVMGTGIFEIGKSVVSGIVDPLTAVTFLLKNAFAIDTQITNIGKELGVSRDIAKDIRGESEAYARSVNDNFINTDRLVKAQAELSQQLGIAVKFSDEEAANFARLTELTGLSAEEAGKLSLLSASSGKSTKDYANSIRSGAFFAQQATKTHFSTKQILQEVSKLSSGILVKFKNNPDAIAKAVVQAKALGTTLEQMDKTGESLLNWESSIENELKAELITGKQLNFEKARAAALTGDQATLMQEVANQAGSLEEFSSMNVIAQKSLAEAFGMSRDEMADMLMKQEAITKYGSEASKLNKEQLEDFEKSGMSLDAFLEKQEQQRSAQEKFADLLTKVQKTIADIAAGPLGSLIAGFASLLDNAFALYSIIGLIGTVSLIKMISGLTTALALKKLSTRESIKGATADAAGAAAKAGGSAASVPAVGWLIAGGVAAALFGALIGYLAGAKKGDDILSEGGYGKRTLLSPEGAIKLNDKDTVIAGTNLGGGKGGGGSSDNTGLMAAINELRNAVNALANKPAPAMAIQVGAEKLGEVVGRQAETGTNQYKNAYRLA
jgi:hypothetical protein